MDITDITVQPLLRTGGLAIQAPESPQFAKLMDGLGAQLDPVTGGWRVGNEASAEMAKLHLRTVFGWREEPPQTLANVRLELDGADTDFASAHEIRLAGRLIAVRRPGEPVTLAPGVRVVSGAFPDTQVTDPKPIFPEPILPAGSGPVTLAVTDVPLEWAAAADSGLYRDPHVRQVTTHNAREARDRDFASSDRFQAWEVAGRGALDRIADRLRSGLGAVKQAVGKVVAEVHLRGDLRAIQRFDAIRRTRAFTDRELVSLGRASMPEVTAQSIGTRLRRALERPATAVEVGEVMTPAQFRDMKARLSTWGQTPQPSSELRLDPVQAGMLAHALDAHAQGHPAVPLDDLAHANLIAELRAHAAEPGLPAASTLAATWVAERIEHTRAITLDPPTVRALGGVFRLADLEQRPIADRLRPLVEAVREREAGAPAPAAPAAEQAEHIHRTAATLRRTGRLPVTPDTTALLEQVADRNRWNPALGAVDRTPAALAGVVHGAPAAATPSRVSDPAPIGGYGPSTPAAAHSASV